MAPDFFDVVERRRSIRRFSPEPVTDAQVERLVDALRHAPSSMDGQPWEVIVLRDAEAKGRLADFKERWCPPEKASYRPGWLRDAPAVLVVCVREAESHDRWVENGAIAATHLLLAATAQGLGATFLTAFHPDEPREQAEARALLGLPPSLLPVCIVPVGHPAEEPAPRRLRSVESIVHHETWRPRATR